VHIQSIWNDWFNNCLYTINTFWDITLKVSGDTHICKAVTINNIDTFVHLFEVLAFHLKLKGRIGKNGGDDDDDVCMQSNTFTAIN
jgi:hypothetical protein